MDKQNSPHQENLEQSEQLERSANLRALFEERKQAKREPLTREKLRKDQNFKKLTNEEADSAIDSIQKLAAILFEMAAHCENKENKNSNHP